MAKVAKALRVITLTDGKAGWEDILQEKPYLQVETYADLPPAGENTGEIVIVCATTGVLFVNRKEAGLYRSDGVNWVRLGELVLAIEHLPSHPPSGKCKVTNLFVNSDTGKLVVEYDDIPV